MIMHLIGQCGNRLYRLNRYLISIALHIWTDLVFSLILEKNSWMWSLYMCTDPELDEEECIVRPFFVELFQSPFLFRELVIDLPDVYGLQHWVVVTGVWRANVYKKVFILQRGRSKAAWARDQSSLRTCKEITARTVSLSFWVSRKAEYSSRRSFDEAMVLSCHTGAAMVACRGGDRDS